MCVKSKATFIFNCNKIDISYSSCGHFGSEISIFHDFALICLDFSRESIFFQVFHQVSQQIKA